MTLLDFWQHADALGAAIITAVLVWALRSRAHRKQRRADREYYRGRLAAERAELHAKYQKTIAALAQRKPTFTEEVTQALDLSRTRLDEAYLDQTIDAAACRPVWTEVPR